MVSACGMRGRHTGSGATRCHLSLALFGLLVAGGIAGCSRTPLYPGQLSVYEVPRIQPIADPLEPLNRGTFGFNHGFLVGVVAPTGSVYRVIVPEPARDCIDRLGTNLAYPVRLFSNLLQGKWGGAGRESSRFGINTTVGLLGLFDPAASWGLEAPEPEDFGQTFGKWGWEADFYFVLPFLGPSSGRNALGTLFDTVLNPGSYIGVATLTKYNKLVDSVEEYKRFVTTTYDPYWVSRNLWSVYRWEQIVDYEYEPVAAGSEGSQETLQSVFLKPRDDSFFKKAKTHKALLPSTWRELPYTCWIQQEPAPVVFVLSGLGGHRLGGAAPALAEMVYGRGFSAVTLSSTLNTEFIENGLTSELPGFPPYDVADMQVALKAVDKDLQRRYPDRVTGRALMGASMGAFQTLCIAAGVRPPTGGPVPFDRFVAIDTPVDLAHGMRELDAYYDAPLKWDQETRKKRFRDTLLKVLDLSGGSLTPGMPLPFTATEAQLLIGQGFRRTLIDVVHRTQRLHDQGIIESSLGKSRRTAAYDEIQSYSWADYFQVFLKPYIERRGEEGLDTSDLLQYADLRNLADRLGGNADIWVFVNENDFLLTAEYRDWLKTTFGDQAVIFPGGGHMGNLFLPDVQASIMKALDGLGAQH